MRLLIVDDDAVFRDELADLLRDEGHDTLVAPSVVKAIERLEESGGDVDVVFTDLRMPRRSGLELLKEVRLRWPRTYVVMITGYATVETAIDAMKLGAFDYIRKPFEIAQVHKTLELVTKAREFSGSLGPGGDVVRDARDLARAGTFTVLLIAPNEPAINEPHLTFARLDPAGLSDLEALIEGFLTDHVRAAVIIAEVDTLLQSHHLEEVTEWLGRIRKLLAGHGPLRIGFDAQSIGSGAAMAIGRAVTSEETNETLEALANPIRRNILLRLADGPAPFGEVMRSAGLDDSPKLSFHLRKLVDDGLLRHEGDLYHVSGRGMAAIKVLQDAIFLPRGSASDNLAVPNRSP